MKKTDTGVVKPHSDKICDRCANTFRQCPLMLVLALSRVPLGMEVEVVNCPEFRSPGEKAEEAAKRGKTGGGLIREKK